MQLRDNYIKSIELKHKESRQILSEEKEKNAKKAPINFISR